MTRKEEYEHPMWKSLSEYVKGLDGNKCVICGSKENLQVHHLFYPIPQEHIWEVPLKFLVTLCKDCHNKVHNRTIEIRTKVPEYNRDFIIINDPIHYKWN